MTPKKIKILHCIRQGAIGGGESHVLDLVDHLDDTKFESIVLAFTPGAMIDRLSRSGIKTVVIPTHFPFDLRVWKRVKKLISKEQVDVIHAHGTRAFSNIFWGAKKLNIPVIYTVHGWSFNDDQSPLKRKLRLAGESFLTKRSHVTINVSESNQNTGIKNINGFQSTVVRYGINLNRFNINKTYKDIRSEIGVPEDVTLIGYIVRITRQKDPITMIKAFDLVAKKSDKVILLMVGDGDLKNEALELIRKLDLTERVIVQGFRQDVPELLKNIDIYCLPSLWEGLPIGLLEAMAMGKAIVATSVDGTKEVIRHNENGILIEPEDYKSLADALLMLHRNPEFRLSLQRKAYESVSTEFNAEMMSRKIEDIYAKSVFNGHS